MANIDILSMPIAIALDGTEWAPIIQGNINKRAQTALIAALPVAGVSPTQVVQKGTITLTASSTTSTVIAPLCSTTSVILFSPATANAAAVIFTTPGIFVVAGSGQFVFTHASNATASRTFNYILFV